MRGRFSDEQRQQTAQRRANILYAIQHQPGITVHELERIIPRTNTLISGDIQYLLKCGVITFKSRRINNDFVSSYCSTYWPVEE
jgi:predicted transcriptional regulator